MLNPVEALANASGASQPAIRLILSVLAAYPLSANLFIACTGIAIVLFNYGFDLYHSALAVAATYLFNLLFATSNLLVPVSFCYHMGYLLVGYYFTTSETYDIKWTMPHCVLVLRLIGLAFDISDSREKELQKKTDDKCISVPSLLELMAFTYFPASVLVGPSLLRFRRFVSGQYESHTTGAPGYAVSDSYLLSGDFEQDSYFLKHVYIGLWGRFTLYKYISIWLLAEGAAVLFGLTYIDAKPGDREYDPDELSGCSNIKVGVFENTSKFGHYVESFNVQTNHWVAVYVYKRLKFLNNRVLSHLGALLMFLAIWHGFHSGYYMTFFMEFTVIRMEKEVEPIFQKNERLQMLLQNPLFKAAVFVLLKFYTIVFAGWCLVPFVFLSFSKWWHVYKVCYFSGSFLFLVGNVAFKPLLRAILPPNKPLPAEPKKTE
uniref:Lysophospholipid acyltransferase 5 n=1 Tax=Psorophora albipes TaxID=869069 RepID=T1E224_9DIPT